MSEPALPPVPPPGTGAVAVGLATFAADGSVLDTWFPSPALAAATGPAGTTVLTDAPQNDAPRNQAPQNDAPQNDAPGNHAPRNQAPQNHAALADLLGAAGPDPVRAVDVRVVRTVIADLASPPIDAHDVYLRLHLLSHRLVRPRGQNLDGLFGLLTNVVWTSAGPCAVDGFEATRARLRAAGRVVTVFGVDKFPRMVDYVVPAGVRIADADRVRLGAHLAPGTVVMHEGFVNFNAGTLGECMVEGRISAGVTVDEGSDIGGGASIIGTLSGGGKEVVTIGKGCLLGANAGTSISLGDGSVVEAGCYVAPGSKVVLPDGSIVKAPTLSGRPNLLFRRNSITGALEAVARTGTWGALNEDLHTT